MGCVPIFLNLSVGYLGAEDDASLNEMLVMVLKDEEYRVDFAVNGQEAWDLINKNEYDFLCALFFIKDGDKIMLEKMSDVSE